jgi:hypothetical protein
MHIKKALLLVLVFACAQASANLPSTVDEYINGEVISVPKVYPSENDLKHTDWNKFNNILNLLTKENYGCVVRQAAAAYDVDPVGIMGSIIGEHTYNVDAWDVWGERYLTMHQRWIKRFETNKISLEKVLSEPNYLRCTETTHTSYDLWLCYDAEWRKDVRNVKKHNAIKWSFFDPRGAGHTFGLGQLGPDRAFMVTDIVHNISGLPLLNPADPGTVYHHILNPQISIHYVAASVLVSIQIYRDLAKFDISNNPGVIATLYNRGKEKFLAKQKYTQNINSLKANKEIVFPATSDFGTLINFKQDEIRAVYEQKIERLSEATCRKYWL